MDLFRGVCRSVLLLVLAVPVVSHAVNIGEPIYQGRDLADALSLQPERYLIERGSGPKDAGKPNLAGQNLHLVPIPLDNAVGIADAGETLSVLSFDRGELQQYRKTVELSQDERKSRALRSKLEGVSPILTPQEGAWSASGKKMLLWHAGEKRSRDRNLPPENHPLEKFLAQQQELKAASVVVHPTLPFAIVFGVGEGALYLTWNGDRCAPPQRLFRRRITVEQASFSPDGKWLCFTTANSDSRHTYVMPVSERLAKHLGAPVLLMEDAFGDNRSAWSTNPTALVGARNGGVYRWDLEHQDYSGGDQVSFHDFLVRKGLEKQRRAGAQDVVEQNRRLISSHADLNHKDMSECGYTALMKAADDGDVESVRILLAAGANPYWRNADGDSALTVAAHAGYLEIVKLLLTPRADRGGALMEAIRGGQGELVKFLLAQGVPVNGKHFNGRTPVMEAIEAGRGDMVRLLIEAKADVNAKDDGGCPVLAFAIVKGDADIVSLLLAAKANVDERYYFAKTPLIEAVEAGRPDLVRLLIDAKANVNAEDQFLNTALSSAVKQGNVDMVQILIGAGADVGAVRDLVKEVTAGQGVTRESVKARLVEPEAL